ncbi:hypothetical protein [Streptomyces sp. SLBN-8D4]|uniref:hypothetical protein n=1 Tax=Streptomyces sp. SLBN-8D4 TaxID=3377728 RepID=UPI003C7AEC6D
MRNDAWHLVLACAAYLGVVFVTNRGLIAAPRYRLLQVRIKELRVRATVLESQTQAADSSEPAGPTAARDLAADETRRRAIDGVHVRLNDLDRFGTVVWRLGKGPAGVVSIPLSKLASAWRALHSVERDLTGLQPFDEISAQARTLQLRLARSSSPEHTALAQLLADTRAEDLPRVLAAVQEEVHEEEDRASERDYEEQRVALWLTTVGLLVVLGLGLTQNHQTTMLFGALGGFLSPVLGVLRSHPRPSSSWGVLLLSPVGGSLAAFAGLLLIRMLADPQLNLLGQVFLSNSWDDPERPIALASALVLGFSGNLLSRLVMAAAGQLAPDRGTDGPPR